MKTIFVSLMGVLALTGFLTFDSINSSKVLGGYSSVTEISYETNDTVPTIVYRDLNTGESINVWYDAVGMRTLNKKTGALVDFYVNTSTNDTVFGRGKFVVNGYVIQGDDGKWKLNDGKVKVDGDELKVKVGDQKLKIDGDEIKIKSNGVKAKSEDGEVKVKTKDGKAKYEDDKIKVKDGDSKKVIKDSTKTKNR